MNRSHMFTKCMLGRGHLVTKLTLVHYVHVLAIHMLVHHLSGLVTVAAIHAEPSLHLRVEVKQGQNLSFSIL